MQSLIAGVECLSLDAGNTVIFLDHARVARLVLPLGFDVSAASLIVSEGAAKRRHAADAMHTCAWSFESAPGARGWGAMVGTMLMEAGLDSARVPKMLDALWPEHVRLNLWSLVPAGFGDAIERVRARGVKVVLVSNSEGMLDVLFRDLAIDSHFDLLLDSGKIGLEKPDPRFFQIALDQFHVAPDHALHLGDVYSTDVLGARAAGMRAALIDPHGHYEGQYEDVPRVPGVVEVANAIATRP